MTREETIKVLAVIRVAYPAFYSKMTAQDAELTVSLWTKMFSGVACTKVGEAIEEYISTDLGGFPPSIAQIKNLIAKDAMSGELSAEEAWELVSKAAEDGQYNAYNQFNKLPERVRKVLGSADRLRTYALMDMRTFDTFERRSFIKEYNEDVERTKHEYILHGCLPNDNQEKLELTDNKNKISSGAETTTPISIKKPCKVTQT